MPRGRDIVPVNPRVLVWARQSIGLTRQRAAELLRVPLDTLQSWEDGREGFGITQLRRIATVYKRPVGALLLPTAPAAPHVPEDFRTVEGIGPSFSVETMVAIRDAQRIQAIVDELLQANPSLFPRADLPQADPLRDSAQETGLVERRASRITTDSQLAWPSANHAYNAWRARIQMRGVLTLAKPMPREDCRGFSLYEPGAVPVIVVNSNEADQAKIFTLFHEYAHVAIRREGICLERDQVNLESWCNRFSSSFLVPGESLRAAAPKYVTSTDEVAEIARRFKVSRHVIAIRLSDLELAPGDMYDRIKQEDDDRQDWEKPQLTEEGEEFPGRPQEAVRLSEVGFGFAGIIISALRSGLITPVDASDFLDIKPEKFGPLADRVGSIANRYR